MTKIHFVLAVYKCKRFIFEWIYFLGTMKRNYDSIAWFYDRLSRLFFGNALVNAQLFLLQAIPAGARILIVGGGTGWILEEITKLHPSGLTITYVDASEKMIALSRKRNMGNNRVTFIAAPIETASMDGPYDVALTPFFLDNFKEGSLQKIATVIDKRLAPGGKWLYCDFQDTDIFWQKAVLKIMYVFFRVSCGIEATHLPDAAGCFSRLQYKMTVRKEFMKGFMAAEIYERV